MIQVGDYARINQRYYKKLTDGQRGRIGVVVVVDVIARKATIMHRSGGLQKGTQRTCGPISSFDVIERPADRVGLEEALYHALELEKTAGAQ